MKSAICTLFEGNYHYGLGALANSLYHYGFRGTIWVGYRGSPPPWASPLVERNGFHEYSFSEGCSLIFVSLATSSHLTNYKPDFMLKVWRELCSDADALFYFDPDIVIKCRWSYYEEWVSRGVALCEDVNSPLLKNHPLRMAWREFYESHSFYLSSDIERYVNGGFIGVKKTNKDFLRSWLKVQKVMAPAIGGLNNTNIEDRTFLFNKTDQDALNIALMNTQLPTSLIGKEGMDFIFGGFTMSHAIGGGKPWVKRYWSDALLKRKSPRLSDNEYWKHTQYPIELYSRIALLGKRLDLGVGKLLSRVMS